MLTSPPKAKRIKKPADLKVLCWVCGAPAADHLHYGGICCYSCRAFFMRSVQRRYACINKSNTCHTTPYNRKQFKLCRYSRCLAVGMRPELVDATLASRKGEQEDQAPDSTATQDDISIESSNDQEERINFLIELKPQMLEDVKEAAHCAQIQPSCSRWHAHDHIKCMPSHKVEGIDMSTKGEIIEDVKTEKEAKEDHTEVVPMCAEYPAGYEVTSGTSHCTILPSEQTYKGSLPYMQDKKFVQEKNIIINLLNENSCSSFSNKVSVITKNPLRSHQELFPASVMNNLIPFKKRESVKDWNPYCQKLSLPGSPTFNLTIEEVGFIDQRVSETKALVLVLHDSCHKYLDDKQVYMTDDELDLEKEHCVEVFRAKAGDIFGKLTDGRKNEQLAEIYSSDLIKSRFLCCAMAAVGVRLFGGPDVDCFPHNHQFYQKYTSLLKSPWTSSLEQERKVEDTLQLLGETIGADKRMEVLFTSAIMRGFRDGSSSAQAAMAPRTPDLLTGTQFSLLLARYLKNTRDQEEAAAIFHKLESLISPLYEATHTFYDERLKF